MMQPKYDDALLQEARDMDLKSPEKALELCNLFLTDNPPTKECSRIVYDCHFQLGNWQFAIKHANELIKLNPNPRMGYFDRGRANYASGNYQDAVTDAQQAIASDKDSVLGNYGHRLMALSYAAQGLVPQAIHTAETMPELQTGEWYLPIRPIPAGTKAQFTAMVERMATQIRDEQQ